MPALAAFSAKDLRRGSLRLFAFVFVTPRQRMAERSSNNNSKQRSSNNKNKNSNNNSNISNRLSLMKESLPQNFCKIRARNEAQDRPGQQLERERGAVRGEAWLIQAVYREVRGGTVMSCVHLIKQPQMNLLSAFYTISL